MTFMHPRRAFSAQVKSRLRATAAVFIATGLVAGLAACAPEAAPAPEPGAKAELVPLNIGVTPTGLSTAQYAALDEGIFEKAGFDVTLTVQANLAEAMPRLLSNELQYIWADMHNAIVARAEGAPLVVGAPTVVAPSKAPESGIGSLNFVVPEASPIQGVEDFEGITIAVSALGGQAHFDIMTVLEREKVDVDKVKFVSIPPPQMAAALRQGQVDAIAIVEPLGSMAIKEGGLRMVGQSDDALPNAPMFVMAATEDFILKDLDQAKRFQEALFEAGALVSGDRKLANKTMEGFLQLPPALIAETTLPIFATKALTEKDLAPVIDRLVRFGALSKADSKLAATMLPIK
jgi:NitT/TauT family transport system substrate-binding protein